VKPNPPNPPTPNPAGAATAAPGPRWLVCGEVWSRRRPRDPVRVAWLHTIHALPALTRAGALVAFRAAVRQEHPYNRYFLRHVEARDLATGDPAGRDHHRWLSGRHHSLLEKLLTRGPDDPFQF